MLLDNLDLLPIYHHIRSGVGMILSKGVNPSENLGVSSFLSHSHPVLSLPFPLPFPFFRLPSLSFPLPFPFPPSFPSPGGPTPKAAGGAL